MFRGFEGTQKESFFRIIVFLVSVSFHVLFYFLDGYYIAVDTYSYVVGVMIFAQSRYMIYNMGILYTAMYLMGRDVWIGCVKRTIKVR